MRKLIIITFISCTFLCCKPRQYTTINGDAQKIISDVITRKGLKNYLLINLSSNKILAEDIKNKLYFEENGDYHEFGELRQIFPDKIIMDVFNNETIGYIVTQLQDDFYWKSENITGLAIIENKNALKESEKKAVLSLSYPVFTRDGKYAFIKYDSATYPYDMGEGGVLVYEKVNGIWTFVNGFLSYFS